MNPAIDPVDTEIRRAMGELANAAPPARPPESFTTESFTTESVDADSPVADFAPLRTTSTTTTDPSSGRRGWLLAAAATVIVAVGGVALVVATADDSPTSVSGPPTLPTAPEVSPLTGEALIDELADRRWVALDRFDDPSPTARTPEFTVTSASGGALVEGFDGCFTFRGSAGLDQETLDSDTISFGTQSCESDALDSGARLDLLDGSIELLPDAPTLVLVDPDGAPLARFHDLERLDPASAGDMPFTFFVDDLEPITFTVSGVGFTQCTRVGWEDTDTGVRVDLLETDACNLALSDGLASGWLADATENGADVLLAPDGILLADDSSVLYLRRLDVVEPDPDGITLAAGAAYGFQPGLGTGPDDVLDALVPRFGPPDFDSGLLPAERNVDDDGNVIVYSMCGDRAEYRELWWGDLSFGFWIDGSRTFLHYWKVGDERITAFLVPDVEVGPVTPTGLTTEDDVGVGDPVTSIPDRFDVSDSVRSYGPGNDPVIFSVLSANPESTPGSVVSPTIGGLYVVVDGEVIGFGAESFTC